MSSRLTSPDDLQLPHQLGRIYYTPTFNNYHGSVAYKLDPCQGHEWQGAVDAGISRTAAIVGDKNVCQREATVFFDAALHTRMLRSQMMASHAHGISKESTDHGKSVGS